MIKGFIITGARPFHRGHEALIEYAKSNCDQLIILVADPPGGEIPYKYRLHWVLSTYLDDPQVEVFGDIVDEPKFGTSDEKSIWWGEYVKNRFGKIDRIFTSENYGELFSATVGAENWVFNKSRTIVPVSATMIRNQPLTYWNYINNFAKDYFVKKVAIVGTESTGKTTLAKRLAEHYKTQWVPEVGRDLIPNSNNFKLDDLSLVGTEHAKNIIRLTRLSNKLLFVDTDLLITKSYGKHFFNEVPKFDPWVEKANQMDYYIFLGDSAPYVDDGTRLPKEERDKLSSSHYYMISDKIKGSNLQVFGYLPSPGYCKGMDPYEHRFGEIVKYIDYEISKL